MSVLNLSLHQSSGVSKKPVGVEVPDNVPCTLSLRCQWLRRFVKVEKTVSSLLSLKIFDFQIKQNHAKYELENMSCVTKENCFKSCPRVFCVSTEGCTYNFCYSLYVCCSIHKSKNHVKRI